MDHLFYNLYDGFVKGLYRERVDHVIDERCLGDWIQTNLTHLDSVAGKLVNMEFPIPFKEASQAAQEIVNLIYANQEYCQVMKVYEDIKNFCPDGECLEDDTVLENLKKNWMPVAQEVYEMFNMLMSAEIETDEESLAVIAELGKVYGTFISYLLDFDQKFSGKEHRYYLAEKIPKFEMKTPKIPKKLRDLF